MRNMYKCNIDIIDRGDIFLAKYILKVKKWWGYRTVHTQSKTMRTLINNKYKQAKGRIDEVIEDYEQIYKPRRRDKMEITNFKIKLNPSLKGVKQLLRDLKIYLKEFIFTLLCLMPLFGWLFAIALEEHHETYSFFEKIYDGKRIVAYIIWLFLSSIGPLLWFVYF